MRSQISFFHTNPIHTTTFTVSPKQTLVTHPYLYTASEKHSQWKTVCVYLCVRVWCVRLSGVFDCVPVCDFKINLYNYYLYPTNLSLQHLHLSSPNPCFLCVCVLVCMCECIFIEIWCKQLVIITHVCVCSALLPPLAFCNGLWN